MVGLKEKNRRFLWILDKNVVVASVDFGSGASTATVQLIHHFSYLNYCCTFLVKTT